MARSCWDVAVLCLLSAAGVRAQGSVSVTLGPLVPVFEAPAAPGNCLSAAQLASLLAAVPVPPPGAEADDADLTAKLFALQPTAGTHEVDVLNSHFTDLSPGNDGVLLSYSCDEVTYDGHTGHDIAIRSFGFQDAGVPVFAARDGTVLFVEDGNFDKHTDFTVAAPNLVGIQHADLSLALYVHLRKDSVVVTVGQEVRAGEQVGEVGSSGYSNYPHLHLQYMVKIGSAWQPRETMSGACRVAPSKWFKQQPLDLTTRLIDFGATSADLALAPPAPEPPPVSAQIALTDTLSIWFGALNLEAHATVVVRFIRPNGTHGGTGPALSLVNTAWMRAAMQWMVCDVAEMHTTPGTWRVQIDIDGVEVIDAPIEVVAVVDPLFNRPPEPISVRLDPPSPLSGRPTECYVLTDAVFDDLDWDIVRYHYVWTINGAEVRNVVTGATRDVLAAGRVQPGDEVRCCVSALDDSVALLPVCVEGVGVNDAWDAAEGGLYGFDGQVPHLFTGGSLTPGSTGTLALSQAAPLSFCFLPVSLTADAIPLMGGVLVPFPILALLELGTDANGGFMLPFTWPGGVPSGTQVVLQAWVVDPSGAHGFSASQGMVGTVP